jgi:hypothetical protein
LLQRQEAFPLTPSKQTPLPEQKTEELDDDDEDEDIILPLHS